MSAKVLVMEKDLVRKALGFFENSAGKATNVADSFSNHTIGFEKLTVGQTAVGLTSSVRTSATKAFITVEEEEIRILTTGSDPTIDTGILVHVDDVVELDGNFEVMNFRAISRSLTDDAVINVEFKD